MIRLTVHFTGHVQGVGFRYTTANVAQRYKVCGFVQNLPDGRVRLVVEGEPDQVNGLVTAVLRQMDRFIDSHTVDQSLATGELGQPGSDPLRVKH